MTGDTLPDGADVAPAGALSAVHEGDGRGLVPDDLRRALPLRLAIGSRLGVPGYDVADAVQDVFIVVHRRLGEFERRSKVSTWLYGICYRVARDRRRSAHVRRRVDDDGRIEERADEHADVAAAAERRQGLELLESILDELPLDQRAVFTRFELESMGGEAIAETLEIPVGTVYSRLRIARDGFRRALGRLQARDQFRFEAAHDESGPRPAQRQEADDEHAEEMARRCRRRDAERARRAAQRALDGSSAGRAGRGVDGGPLRRSRRRAPSARAAPRAARGPPRAPRRPSRPSSAGAGSVGGTMAAAGAGVLKSALIGAGCGVLVLATYTVVAPSTPEAPPPSPAVASPADPVPPPSEHRGARPAAPDPRPDPTPRPRAWRAPPEHRAIEFLRARRPRDDAGRGEPPRGRGPGRAPQRRRGRRAGAARSDRRALPRRRARPGARGALHRGALPRRPPARGLGAGGCVPEGVPEQHPRDARADVRELYSCRRPFAGTPASRGGCRSVLRARPPCSMRVAGCVPARSDPLMVRLVSPIAFALFSQSALLPSSTVLTIAARCRSCAPSLPCSPATRRAKT